MGTSMILAGLGLAAVGFAGRYAARSAPQAAKKMEEAFKAMPKIDAQTWQGRYDYTCERALKHKFKGNSITFYNMTLIVLLVRLFSKI